MGQPGGANKNLTLPDCHHVPALTLRFEVQFDVTVNLLKKFLAGLAMKIEPLIRAVQNHDKEFVVVREDSTGPVRRIEEMPVFLDPGFEID